MCGVPFHSYESYVARLVGRGYKVAICEQVEDPATAKGLVKRDIIRILTPGTVIEGSMLDESKNNYLAVLYATEDSKEYGLCFCDCSTGEIHLTQLSGDDLPVRVSNELGRFSPSEILVNRTAASCKSLQEFVERRLNGKAEVRSDIEFDTETGMLTAIVIFGRNHFLGLFGKENDIIIPWNEIEVIGNETILVNCDVMKFS